MIEPQPAVDHISEIMPIYVNHLLDSDYLLWIRENSETYDYKIYKKDFAKNYTWEKNCFSFTRPSIDEWNESNTVKYKDISIGEFQVHKSRSCFKFRFNMENFDMLIQGNLMERNL